MNIDFPFHINRRGRSAVTDDERHLRNMIEQLLFTNPGERVNRPDFGSGLLSAIFSPSTAEIAAPALQISVQTVLQKWLGDLIEPTAVHVTAEDATLKVVVQYLVRRTGERRAEVFERSGIR
jgi:phage baseplate assembly protein W